MVDSDEDGVVESLDGRRIGYLARGPGAGRRVLYLHGMPGCRLEQRLIPDDVLHRFGIRLVSIDRPGWGRTDPLAGGRVERIADALALCDALGIETFPLVAFSAGGSYAVTLAAVAPERVERVVLVSAQMPYDDLVAIKTLQPDQLAMLPGAAFGRIPPVVDASEEYRAAILADPMAALAASLVTITGRERTLLEQPWFRAALSEDVIEGVEERVDGVIDDFLAWPVSFEVDLTTIRCPVRAVHGTADDWEPLPNLTRILRSLHDTQLVILEGMNHLGPMVYPDLAMALAVSDR